MKTFRPREEHLVPLRGIDTSTSSTWEDTVLNMEKNANYPSRVRKLISALDFSRSVVSDSRESTIWLDLAQILFYCY